MTVAESATTACGHNEQRARPDDPQHAWECASCGYIYGLGDRQLKIISGGQTGIDQLGLVVAVECGLPTGGWAPKGWVTETGPGLGLAALGLVEHREATYPPRTRANARMADGTVWFGESDSRGYRCTQQAALGKPWLVNPDAPTLRAWLASHRIRVLNVAGSRGSRLSPDTHARALAVLTEVLR